MAVTFVSDPRLAAFIANPDTITPANADQIRAVLLATVGEGAAPEFPAAMDADCEFDLGFGAIWTVVERIIGAVCTGMQQAAALLEAIARAIIRAVLAALVALVSSFVFAFETFIEVITSRIAAAIEVILGTLDLVVGSIVRTLGAAVEAIIGVVGDSVGRIIDSVDNAIDVVIAKAEEIFTTVSSAVANVVTTIGGALAQSTTSILAGITKAIDAIASVEGGVIGAIQDGIAFVLNGIGSAISAVIDVVSSGFGTLLNAATTVVDRIQSGIASVIGVLVDKAAAVFDAIGSALSILIETVTGTAEAGLGAIRSVIEDIPQALREFASEAVETITNVVGAPLGNMGTLFIDQIEKFFARLIDDLNVSPGKILEDFLLALGLPAAVVARFALAATIGIPKTPAFFMIGMALIVPLLLLPMVATAMGPVLEQMRQEVNKVVRPTLLEPSDAIEAFIRGSIDTAQLSDELAQAGFSDERITRLIINSRALLGLGEGFRMWLRDIITEDELDALIHNHRLSTDDGARLKQVIFFVPPVQDLISMAVREVFSPTIRDRFQLDEDFPSEFAVFAHQQGVSEEWAKNYWAAHWVLPSLNQGFEMLHRRVITAEDLDLLMRTQDVMPFWRENLKQIAFSPLTRVDVRRMHDLGLITEDELLGRYMDIGFDESNAEMMKQFTVAFNAPDPPEIIELEGLTRGTILNMFDDGILDETETREILVTLGVGDVAADLFISQRQSERQRRERKALIEGVVELATGAVISLPEAQDSLFSAGLTAVEIALAVQQILRNRSSRDRLPTIAELTKMQQATIIDSEEWRDAMAGHGFPDVWIERLELFRGLLETKRNSDGDIV